MPIAAANVRGVMTSCKEDKSPGLDGLTYELYFYMPDLLCSLLADICCRWQLNGRIYNSVSLVLVALLTMNLDKGDQIENFSHITLLDRDIHILGKVLIKRLALVVELTGDAQFQAERSTTTFTSCDTS